MPRTSSCCSALRAFFIVGMVSVTAVMSGCTAEASPPELPSVSIVPSGCIITDDVPLFYGPWAGDIEAAYSRSESDVAKQILCSGSITEEHVAEVNEALKSCLADSGITKVSIDQYGILEITIPPDFPESAFSVIERACEDSTGWYPVSSLYGNMQQNPNKGDVNQLIADCLVRVGLKPEGFSGADVAAEYQGGEAFPDINEDPLFPSCLFNPVGTG